MFEIDRDCGGYFARIGNTSNWDIHKIIGISYRDLYKLIDKNRGRVFSKPDECEWNFNVDYRR